MLMRQVKVRKKCLGIPSKAHTMQTCWVDDDPRLQIGCKVQLKDEPNSDWWEVVWMGCVTQEKQALYKPWRVGGLS